MKKRSLAMAILLAGSAYSAYAQDLVTPFLKPPDWTVQNFESERQTQLVQATKVMRADKARDEFDVDGSGLTAVIIDTGINAAHVDFAGRLVAGANYTTDAGGDDANYDDGNGHGTNVAGIIAANDVHVGIAPGADIIALKVLADAGNSDLDWTLQALRDCLAQRDEFNITVINMSLGTGDNLTTDQGLGDFGDDFNEVISDLRDEGVVVCIAAGNDFFAFDSEQGMSFPGICRAGVSVGALYDADVGRRDYLSGASAFTTGKNRITPFSQRLHSSKASATRTDVFAPGGELTSSGIGSTTASSSMDGTSQASPCVAGVVLLMQQYHLRRFGSLPDVGDVEKWLRDGYSVRDGDDEDDNVKNTGETYPAVDAYDALKAIQGSSGSATNKQYRVNGAYANYFAQGCFSYAGSALSVPGGYTSNAQYAYIYGYYGYVLGLYAGDTIRWGGSTSRNEALGDYLELRYYQYLYDYYAYLYAGEAYYTGTDSLYAYLFAAYACNYAAADLSD